MAAMQNLLGKHEGTDRAALVEYMKNGGVNLDPATTAWCAAIVNASLGQAGLPTTGSNMARSFLNYGQAVTEPQQGDIAVFQRGGPNATTGHVGFYQGRDAAGNILVLGGNQGDKVSVAPFAANSLLGYRRIPAPGTAPGSAFQKAALSPFQRAEQPLGQNQAEAWAQTKKGDVVDFNQQGQPAVPEQRRGPLADRLPNAPPVNTTVPVDPNTGASLPPPRPPDLAQRPSGMGWSQQVFSGSEPGANMNVAAALRDQAIQTGRMPWASQAGTGGTSPGMVVGAPSGAGAVSSTAPPAPSTNPFIDWLTQRAGDIWNNTNRSASAPARWF